MFFRTLYAWMGLSFTGIKSTGSNLVQAGCTSIRRWSISASEFTDQCPAPTIVCDSNISRVACFSWESTRISCLWDQFVSVVIQFRNHLSWCVRTAPCQFVQLACIQYFEQVELIWRQWDPIPCDVCWTTETAILCQDVVQISVFDGCPGPAGQQDDDRHVFDVVDE